MSSYVECPVRSRTLESKSIKEVLIVFQDATSNLVFLFRKNQQVESEHVLSRLSDMRIVSVVSAHFPSLIFNTTPPKKTKEEEEKEKEKEKEKEDEEYSDDSEDEAEEKKKDVYETNQSLQTLQHVVNTLQVIASRVDGCVYDTICTNEGTTILLTFGLERVREVSTFFRSV